MADKRTGGTRSQIPLRLPAALKRQLEARAADEGLSLNAWIVAVLRKHGTRRLLPPAVLKALRKSETQILRGLRETLPRPE